MNRKHRNMSALGIIAVAVVLAVLFRNVAFNIYPEIRTLPVGSCVRYGDEVWKITGPEDTSRIIVPVMLIGYTDKVADSRVGRTDAFTAGDANNFEPISCSAVYTAPVCQPSWTCGAWTICNAGTQSRTCTDGCGASRTESQFCNGGQNNDTNPTCQQIQHQSCMFWQDTIVQSDTLGCPISYSCVTNDTSVSVLGVIGVILIVASVVFVWRSRKK